MIRTKYGDTKFSGEITELCADVSTILRGFREILDEEYGEMADLVFAEVGRIACMSDDEDLLSEENVQAAIERVKRYKEERNGKRND